MTSAAARARHRARPLSVRFDADLGRRDPIRYWIARRRKPTVLEVASPLLPTSGVDRLTGDTSSPNRP
eukprot:4184663-Pyramimonas_sp.AAC.1